MGAEQEGKEFKKLAYFCFMRTKFPKTALLMAICCLITVSTFAQPKKVLFIGNSYTAVNSLPWLVYSVALANGDTISTDVNSPGGYTFEGHSADSVTLAKINSQQWDYVILQEQSQRPSFPPSQVQAEVYPYAAFLDSVIHANNPCTEVVFYMTWGRKNGDASNCAGWPPVCTYEGMQARLRESYMEMGALNDATVAPVGAAWSYARSLNPLFDLYAPDESHPSMYGSYLAANVIYSTMFNKSTIGNPFHTTITVAEAAILQDVAHAVVIDSIDTWYQHGNLVATRFSYTNNLNTVQFNNTSLHANSYLWDFGDGATSTAVNPSHTYTSPGIYNVTLTASNGCKSAKFTLPVTVGTTGVNEFNSCFWNISSNQMLSSSCKLPYESRIAIYSVDGRIVLESSAIDRFQLPDLSKGTYLISITGNNNHQVLKWMR